MPPPHTNHAPSTLPPALNSMTMLVAAVIVHDTDKGRVLLLQRGPNAKFGQGSWDLPIGKGEPGEPITTTAVRELHEETGLTVQPESLRVAHLIHSALGVGAPNGYFTVVFSTREWQGEPVNAEPHKHSEVRWFSTSEVPEDFVNASAYALNCYLTGGPQVSIDGWH